MWISHRMGQFYVLKILRGALILLLARRESEKKMEQKLEEEKKVSQGPLRVKKLETTKQICCWGRTLPLH